MALDVGSHADITLLNVTIMELSPDGTWVRVQLPAGISGTVDMWLPTDVRINAVPIVPANWPPHEADVWQSGTTVAWAIPSKDGTKMFFVTEGNIQNQTQPTLVGDALVRFGNTLTLLYRKA